jgi:hypothetical protein
MAIGLIPKAEPRFRRKDVSQDASALQDSSKDVSQDASALQDSSKDVSQDASQDFSKGIFAKQSYIVSYEVSRI